MYLRVSKQLDVPTHRLTNASVFPLVFILYASQVLGILLYLSSFLVLIYHTNMKVEKNEYCQKKEKSPHETEYEDELPRIRPCEQEGLKHRLIDFDAVTVLI